MQLLLPIFPVEIQLLTPTLGVFSKDDMVYYVHSGEPIYSHPSEDIKSFRYSTSNLILQGWCKKRDVTRVFGVSDDRVNRHVKQWRAVGESGFFNAINFA